MTTARLNRRPPRLLDLKSAAEYCGVSAETFETYFKVRAIRLGKRDRGRKLFDVREIDRAIDQMAGVSGAPNKEELLEGL